MKSIRARKMVSAALACAAFSVLPAGPAAAAQPGSDWLWLSANLNGCTWTVTVTWAGYQEAKYLEVFTTETYTGAPLVPTVVRIKNRESTATVMLAPLADSPTAAIFYPWAQLLDVHGNAIPASLDFSGGNLGYCTAP